MFISAINHMEFDLLDGASAAAAYVGLSRRQIYRLAEQGLVPVIRKGRRLYFRKSELERAFSADGLMACSLADRAGGSLGSGEVGCRA